LENPDARVFGATYDQSRPEDVLSLLKSVKEKFNVLDHVVASAGIHAAAPLGMIDDDSLNRLFQINSIGVLRLIQGSLKLLRKSPAPSIVLLGSIMAMDGIAGQAGYAMSKAAISGLVRPLAREVGPRGIRINCVLPGYIATDMTSRLSEDSVGAVVARTPLGRIGRPKEVADAVLYLLSDESSFVTGSFLEVDGGLAN
jgi:3-oxoacyl-[acyl-carrier protein] reductase